MTSLNVEVKQASVDTSWSFQTEHQDNVVTTSLETTDFDSQ